MTEDILPDPSYRVVIIGGGHAGGLVAAQLKQLGFPGQITIVGEERRPPYQRPPLSKAWLVSDAAEASVLLKPEDWYEQNGIDLRIGQVARTIDRTKREVELGDGETLSYDSLILATGARARVLPIEGAESRNVFSVRTPEDSLALRRALGPGKTFVLIGAGYIGLEVAAAIQKTGGRAIVIECEARVLARVASPTFAAFIAKRHVEEGVQFETGARVSTIDASDGVAKAVVMSDGTRIACDGIVVGVGVLANDELARAAGLDCDQGVLVNDSSQTVDSCIFAIGDVSRRPVAGYDLVQRLESVPSAIEQAKQVAMQICGQAPAASDIPWFWSDQYDMKLQIAGLWAGCDQQVVRKSAALDRFMVFHLTGNRVRAVESCGSVQDFMAARKLIARGQTVDASALANSETELKTLMTVG